MLNFPIVNYKNSPVKLNFIKTFIYNLKCYNIFLITCKTKEPRKVMPILKTDEPVCPEGKLSCGNGECVEKELFCNDKPDCKDESDENACSMYFLIFYFCILPV